MTSKTITLVSSLDDTKSNLSSNVPNPSKFLYKAIAQDLTQSFSKHVRSAHWLLRSIRNELLAVRNQSSTRYASSNDVQLQKLMGSKNDVRPSESNFQCRAMTRRTTKCKLDCPLTLQPWNAATLERWRARFMPRLQQGGPWVLLCSFRQ